MIAPLASTETGIVTPRVQMRLHASGCFRPDRFYRRMEMAEDLQQKVVDLIVDQLGVDADSVTPEAHFIDDLGADSLDTVELVMAFEEEFDIEIPDEDAEKLEAVKDAIGYLKKRMEE